MRKIFVVLLVLAIAGGALAQEAEEASEVKKGSLSESTWTGEVGLKTGFRIVYDDMEGEGKGFGDMEGEGPGDAFLKIRWDYTKGKWSIALPFTVDKHGVHTYAGENGDENDWGGKLAKVEYTDGPLTVTLPFAVHLQSKKGTNKDTGAGINADTDNGEFSLFTDGGLGDIDFYNASGISAKYVTDTFGFGFTINDIYEVGNSPWPKDENKDDKTANDSRLTSADNYQAWGWYDLMGGNAKLAVSYHGGDDGATTWWRTSDIVLTGKVSFWPDEDVYNVGIRGGIDGTNADDNYDYHWENIGGDHSGVAFKYNIGDFGFGVSFVSHDENAWTNNQYEMFTEGEKGSASTNAADFFRHFTFGLGYFTDPFSASAMLGFEKNGPEVDDVNFNIYAGAKVAIGDSLKIGFDTSIFINMDADIKDDDYLKENSTIFNIGLGVDFNEEAIEEGFWASLKFAAVDLARKAPKNSVLNDPGYTGPHYNSNPDKQDADDQVGLAEIGALLRLGYNMPLSETLNFNIAAGAALFAADKAPSTYLFLGITPKLIWKGIGDNGSITIENDLLFSTEMVKGDKPKNSNDDEYSPSKITNKLTFAFKWAF